MAKGTRRTRQSGLVGHLGTRGQAAHEEHKDDEVVFSTGGDLPGGIKGGIARLAECRFGVYEKGNNKGEYFWYVAGIVVSPKTCIDPETKAEIRIEGLRTSITEPICDTPQSQGKKKTLDDHLQWMYNELRKLGVEPGDYKNFLGDLEDKIAPALKQAAPYFRFRTWQGEKSEQFPDPRINHDWQGVCEYEEEEGDDVVDDTVEDAGLQVDPEELEGDDIPFDRSALAALADEDDEDAQVQMTELAEAAGIDLNDYLENTWVEVDEAMTAQEVEGNGKQDEEPGKVAERDDPEKTEVYRYKRPGAKKLAEYEVTLVSVKEKTVSLRSLDDRKLFPKVSWAKLVD